VGWCSRDCFRERKDNIYTHKYLECKYFKIKFK
jgi:hypothetical protein